MSSPQGRDVAGAFADTIGIGQGHDGRRPDRLRLRAVVLVVAASLAVAVAFGAIPALQGPVRLLTGVARPAPARSAAAPVVAAPIVVTPPPAVESPVATPATAPASGPPAGTPGQQAGPGAGAPAASSAVASSGTAGTASTPAPAAPAPVTGFTFEDGGTDGWGSLGNVTSLANGSVAHDGAHSLQIVLHSTGNSDLPFVFVFTSGPTSGQTVSMWADVAPGGASVQGKAWVEDTNLTWHMASLSTISQGGWTRLSVVVPAGITVRRIGAQFLASPFNTSATVYLDSVSWA